MISSAILIGIILIGVISHFFNEKRDEQNIEIAKEVLVSCENELFMASKVMPGYERQFILPDTINNEEYNLTIDGDSIILSYESIDFIGIAPNVTGSLVKGTNTVKNIDGKVCLNTEVC